MTHVYNADECFTTVTMGELAWVGKIDGRVIGDGQAGGMGAMTRRLSELFFAKTKNEGVVVC